MVAMKIWPGAFKTGMGEGGGLLRWAFLAPAIVALVLVIFATAEGSTVNAAREVGPTSDLRPIYADRGGGELSESDGSERVPIASDGPPVAGSNSGAWPETEWTYPPDDDCWLNVWSAKMMVGEESKSTLTYTGYIPSLAPGIGHLTPDTFDYRGKEYVVEGLFQQAMTGGDTQLVLVADRPLPHHLLLSVGKDRFFVLAAKVTGRNKSTYVWILDTDMGWGRGDITYAALAETKYGEPGPEETNLPDA